MIKKFVTGIAGGLIGGVVGVIAGVLFTRLLLMLIPRRSGGWEDLIFGLLAVVVSYPIGAGLGAGIALRRYSRRGMIWKAVLAAVLGEVVVLLLADPLGLNLATNLMFGAIAIMPVAAILAAFWFNRQREETP